MFIFRSSQTNDERKSKRHKQTKQLFRLHERLQRQQQSSSQWLNLSATTAATASESKRRAAQISRDNFDAIHIRAKRISTAIVQSSDSKDEPDRIRQSHLKLIIKKKHTNI